jgi:hypothetical protein
MHKIKANDLRIGNFVTNEFNDIIKVESIDNNRINLSIEDDGLLPECSST